MVVKTEKPRSVPNPDARVTHSLPLATLMKKAVEGPDEGDWASGFLRRPLMVAVHPSS